MPAPEHESSGRDSGLLHYLFDRDRRLFLVTVAVPTLLSVLYFGLIASDVYISESRFVVRSPNQQATSPLGMILKGTGFTRAQDESYTVYDFMLSRDALKGLEESVQISAAFSRHDIDIFSRFPGIDWDDSFEALHRYYQKHINVQFDPTSSISTLTVRAFTAQDAQKINESLLGMGETLVNRLNERGRQDLVHFASAEVEGAEQKAKAAALALSDFRNTKGVVNPDKQATIQLEQIARLQEELIATRGQLIQVMALAGENPQIPVLEQHISSLQNEIETEINKVTGGERSLANKAAEYQRLALENEFADKQLTVALASLEEARNEALRKQLYLERIVLPSLPDRAMEPRRLRSVFATLVLGLISWGILTILIAGVREHRD